MVCRQLCLIDTCSGDGLSVKFSKLLGANYTVSMQSAYVYYESDDTGTICYEVDKDWHNLYARCYNATIHSYVSAN